MEIEFTHTEGRDSDSKGLCMKKLIAGLSGLGVAAVAAAIIFSTVSGAPLEDENQYLVEAKKYKPVNAALNVESPTIGDCWMSTSFPEVYESSYYEAGQKVPCSSSHDSVTFHVEALPADMHMFYEPGATFGHTAGTYDEVDLIQDKCGEALIQTFSSSKTRLNWMWFLPDPFAWAAGARWLRCDVFVSKVGSLVGTEGAEVIYYGIDALQSRHANNDFQLCVNLGDSGNPLAGDARYADCDGSWDQMLIAEKDLAADYSDGYPGESTVTSEANQFCSDAESDTYSYPNESGWEDGTSMIRCWINRQ